MRLRDLSQDALAEVIERFCRTHRLSLRRLAQLAGLAESTVILMVQGKHKARPRTCDRLEQVIPPDGRLLPGFAVRDEVLRGYGVAHELAMLRDALEQPAASLAGHWAYLTDETAAHAQVFASMPVSRRIREEVPWRELAERLAQQLTALRAQRDPKRAQPMDVLLLAPGHCNQEKELVALLAHYTGAPLSVLLLDASPPSLRRAEKALVGSWTTGTRIQSVLGSVLALDAAQGLLPAGRARVVVALGDLLGELLLEEPLLTWLRLLPPGDLVLLEVLTDGTEPKLADEGGTDDLNLCRLRLFLGQHLAPHGQLHEGELELGLESAPDAIPGCRTVHARAVRRRAGREQRWRLPFARYFDLDRLLDLLRHLSGLQVVQVFRNGWDLRRRYLLLERVPEVFGAGRSSPL